MELLVVVGRTGCLLRCVSEREELGLIPSLLVAVVVGKKDLQNSCNSWKAVVLGGSTRWGKENGSFSSSKVRDARQAKGFSEAAAAAAVVVMVFLVVADLQLRTTACRSQSSAID